MNTSNFWFILNIGIVVVASVSSLFAPLDTSNHGMTWLGLVLAATVFPVLLLLAAMLLRLLLGPKLQIEEPSLKSNPFDFKRGERIFYLGSWVFICSGMVGAVREYFASHYIAPIQVAPLALGTALLLTLHALGAISRGQKSNGS